MVALDRIDDILQLKKPQSHIQGKEELDLASVSLTIRELQVHHGDHLVLDNIDFTVNAGEIVALVGPTGVGKSTIADLIAGLQNPLKEKILINDTPIDSLNAETRNKSIAVAFQESFLFADTVRENIALGRPYSDSEILEALKITQALDFVQELPKGLQSVLGERGSHFLVVNVSG